MIRLLYLSQAGLSTPEQLDDILQVARRHNPAQAITGVLVHGGGWFMQLLEGPEAAVLKLYARILDDRRHADPRVIHVTPTDRALFGDWSMGFVDRSPLEFEHVAALRARRLETANGTMFAETLREFMRCLRSETSVHPAGRALQLPDFPVVSPR